MKLPILPNVPKITIPKLSKRYYIISIAFMGMFLTYGGYWVGQNYMLQSPILIKLQSPLKPINKNKNISFVPKAYGNERIIKAEDVNKFDWQEVQAYVKQETIREFSESEWDAMNNLITGESGFRTYALNHIAGGDDGACGIFQALPCEKLGPKGLDLENQVQWGLKYIKDTYGTPTNANEAWMNRSPHWY